MIIDNYFIFQSVPSSSGATRITEGTGAYRGIGGEWQWRGQNWQTGGQRLPRGGAGSFQSFPDHVQERGGHVKRYCAF